MFFYDRSKKFIHGERVFATTLFLNSLSIRSIDPVHRRFAIKKKDLAVGSAGAKLFTLKLGACGLEHRNLKKKRTKFHPSVLVRQLLTSSSLDGVEGRHAAPPHDDHKIKKKNTITNPQKK